MAGVRASLDNAGRLVTETRAVYGGIIRADNWTPCGLSSGNHPKRAGLTGVEVAPARRGWWWPSVIVGAGRTAILLPRLGR